jgi:hypothetical protein
LPLLELNSTVRLVTPKAFLNADTVIKEIFSFIIVMILKMNELKNAEHKGVGGASARAGVLLRGWSTYSTT